MSNPWMFAIMRPRSRKRRSPCHSLASAKRGSTQTCRLRIAFVGFGGVVAAYPIQVRFVEAAADPPSPWRDRALPPERTGLAGRHRCLVDPAVGRVALGQEAQHRVAW